MKPEEFIELYTTALGSQKWKNVDPLISENAIVTFSNGSVHIGKDNVREAFEKNFRMIKNESYSMDNIFWLKKEETFAVYVFEFNWSGYMDQKLISGSGIGTSVIIRESERWQLLTEHLGRK